MATVHQSIRVEEETAKAIDGLKRDEETKAAVYNRVLKAGLEALTGEPEATENEPRGEAANESELATLRDYVALLKKQLEVKDEQIGTLTRVTEQAQTLHAMTESKALEPPKEERRGWLSRIIGR